MPIVAFRKKILDGHIFWVQDLFTECENLVFRGRWVDIHTKPATSHFPSYLCPTRVPGTGVPAAARVSDCESARASDERFPSEVASEG